MNYQDNNEPASGIGAGTGGRIDDESVVELPSVIDVPDRPEDTSCASSVTTHFQDAELLAPHMYPTAQNLQDTEDMEDPTFQPVAQQPKGLTTKNQPILPPLPEESSQQDPTDSKNIHTSSQKLDEIRILKENEKDTIQDLSAEPPSMATLESRINQKTHVYSVQQISFQNKGDANIGISPAIQKGHSEDEVAKNQNELIGAPNISQCVDSTFRGKDRSNQAISSMDPVVNEGATSSPSSKAIQETPMFMNMPSLARTRRTVVLESIPGAHAIQTFQTRQQTSQGSSSAGMNTDAQDEEEAQADIQQPPPESLAEARPVSEDDLPVATADNGNRIRQKRSNLRFYLMEGIFVLLIAAGIIVGTVCGTGHCSQNVYVDGSSTVAPTTTRDAVAKPEIEIALKMLLGRDYFQHVDESSKGFDSDLAGFLLKTRLKAFDWIVNQDPMQLEYDSPNLLQRFVLVLFYYQTTRLQPWKVCNPAAATQGSATSGFCYALNQLSGEITTNMWGDRWLSASHECHWAGITCGTAKSEEKRISGLLLSSNQLNGPLPWEISQLAQLKRLGLSYNMLTGTLPPRLFWSDYSLSVEHLNLIGNRLTGTIPGEWFVNLHEGNGKLELLLIAENRLTGTIPSEVGLFPLRVLVAGRNVLIGSLPMDLFYQSSLGILRVEDNQITGTIPTEIGLLANFSQIDVSGNSISGFLPSEIGLAKGLTGINLHATNMQGTLPEELYTELNRLRRLYLNGCSFSGTISSSLGLLTNLAGLNLANNHFHGTIPSEIETLTGLSQLLVNGNKLSGTVPVSVCQRFVYFRGKEVLLVADCLPNTETGVPPINCGDDCCTSCCGETGVCLAN